MPIKTLEWIKEKKSKHIYHYTEKNIFKPGFLQLRYVRICGWRGGWVVSQTQKKKIKQKKNVDGSLFYWYKINVKQANIKLWRFIAARKLNKRKGKWAGVFRN